VEEACPVTSNSSYAIMLHVVPMFFYNWLRKPGGERRGSAHGASLEDAMKAAALQLKELEERESAGKLRETYYSEIYPSKVEESIICESVQPMRKVPFVTLDIHLDETERSEDDGDETMSFVDIRETALTVNPKETAKDEESLPRVVRSASLLDLLAVNKELSASPAVIDLVARVSESDRSPCAVSRDSPESPVSCAAPPILHRTPIPSEIVCAPLMTDESDASESSSGDDEILDPTEAILYGWIENSYLQQVGEQMNDYLAAASDDDIASLCRETALLIQQHPMACQVKYKPPEFEAYCYPLSYFSAAGWLEGCEAAYGAFPEAIGQEQDNQVGLPLHYACFHQASYEVVHFLTELYSEATRVTNAEHQTPLHLACRSKDCKLEVVELLLKHYPTAAQLADLSGFTPLHLACQYGAPLPILQALQASSPTVIRAVTLSWHRPLHIATMYGAELSTVEWIIQKDPSAVRATVEDFSTALHSAAAGGCAPAVIECLIKAHPLATILRNEDDETPYNVGLRCGASSTVLKLLEVAPEKTQ
jgi:hypothetical protein